MPLENLSKRAHQATIYPYLLGNVKEGWDDH